MFVVVWKKRGKLFINIDRTHPLTVCVTAPYATEKRPRQPPSPPKRQQQQQQGEEEGRRRQQQQGGEEEVEEEQWLPPPTPWRRG